MKVTADMLVKLNKALRIKAADAAWRAAWDAMIADPNDATRAAYLAAHKVREDAYESLDES